MKTTLPISVCMIVRDEEANLAGAIMSVQPFVREVIVVDTGSQDRTVEIARSLGARVHSFPWQNDFSLARNTGLQAATQDWILSLDADQRFDSDSLPALAEAIRGSFLAYNVTIRLFAEEHASDSVGAYSAIRLFRRDKRIRYSGRVHEDVAPSLLPLSPNPWTDSAVVLRDFGYGTAQERFRKRERNLHLLARAKTENPDDLFVLYKYAITLPDTQKQERTDTLVEASIKASRLNLEELRALSFIPRLVSAAVDACFTQGRLSEAAQLPRFLLPAFGGDCCFIAGRAAARAGDVPSATEFLERFLSWKATQETTTALLDTDASEAEACLWLCWLARLSGASDKAHAWLIQGLRTASPEQVMPLECERIRLLFSFGAADTASEKLGELYPLAQASDAALAELMLVSAEIADVIGDKAGAMEMARAAIRPGDDRACALLATLEMNNGPVSNDRLAQLMASIPGLRFDTAAVRAALVQRIAHNPDPSRHISGSSVPP